jgi:alpha-ribazole phosphatase
MNERLTLHLLRHGAPMTSGLLLGHTDMPATSEGEAQLLAKAEGLDCEQIITSDLIRCAASAQKIASLRGRSVHLDPRWRELHFGEWDGLHPSEVDADRMAQFWSDPDANPSPGGETRSTLTERVGEALSELTGGTALIITHGGAIRAALHHLLGWPHPLCWSIALPYAVRCTLGLWRDETSLTGWRGQLEALEP